MCQQMPYMVRIFIDNNHSRYLLLLPKTNSDDLGSRTKYVLSIEDRKESELLARLQLLSFENNVSILLLAPITNCLRGSC
jgi:hypothetical protein